MKPKDVALYEFFSSFGLPAYVATNVPEDAEFPRLTYEPVFGSLSGGPVSVGVNLWYRTESERTPNSKADEIFKRIGESGITFPCAEGIIWINRDSPWCQNLSDPDDSLIKRRYLLMTAQFLTID